MWASGQHLVKVSIKLIFSLDCPKPAGTAVFSTKPHVMASDTRFFSCVKAFLYFVCFYDWSSSWSNCAGDLLRCINNKWLCRNFGSQNNLEVASYSSSLWLKVVMAYNCKASCINTNIGWNDLSAISAQEGCNECTGRKLQPPKEVLHIES